MWNIFLSTSKQLLSGWIIVTFLSSISTAITDNPSIRSSSTPQLQTLVRSPLDGKHLVVSGLATILNFNLIWNSNGSVVDLRGVGGEMVRWLSVQHNFSFSFLQINKTVGFEDTKDQIGLVTYIIKGECDIVGSVLPTAARVRVIEFTHPTLYNEAKYLIPSPDYNTVSLLTILKPFQTPVWIGILASVTVVFLYLNYFVWYVLPPNSSAYSNLRIDIRMRVPFLVFGLLVNQAPRPIATTNLPILSGVATWCLATFVLVTAYNSLLTSYIMAPNPQLLINSIDDLKTRPHIRVVTDKDRNAEALLMSAETGYLKELGDKLRAYPENRCTSTRKCTEMVKQGSSVYVAGTDAFLLNAMFDDLRLTGKCNLELGKDEIFQLCPAWAMQKFNPYTDTINKGTMRMRETGLLFKWRQENRADVHQCLNNRQDENKLRPLTLKNFAGTFSALIIGLFLSVSTFVGELIINCWRSKSAIIFI